ncbi:MAG: hypothetical protein EZS28_020337 [Streblomastix strix]|uniref:Uncharacterized protein n=1 Tax=Streblomastix strix TaxID=222440 RepID=A0A5J4VNA8_9EUKA|nr:MAG: hypothetical protein EZS28_020337 [Streblomastix strix]
MQIQIHAVHFHGEENVIQDSFSRLMSSRDYSLKDEVHQKIHECTSKQLGENRGLFLATLQKIESEIVETLLIVPYWPAQPWWPVLVRVMSKYMILGKKRGRSETRRTKMEALKASTSKKNDGLIDRGNRKEELFKWALNRKDFSNLTIKKVICRWDSIYQRHRQRLRQFEVFWKTMGKLKEYLSDEKDLRAVVSNIVSHNDSKDVCDENQTACLTAIETLFQQQEVHQEKIDGFALRQRMKKPQVVQCKPTKDETILHIYELYRYAFTNYGLLYAEDGGDSSSNGYMNDGWILQDCQFDVENA